MLARSSSTAPSDARSIVSGSPQPEQLVQLVPQHGVDLGLRAGELEPVGVAHAPLLGQGHRSQHQRRVDGRAGVVLHVVPAQERDHQAQLVPPVLGTVAAGRRDQRVQGRRGVGGVVPADQRADVDGLAVHQPRGRRPAPREQLRRADVPHVEDQRHGRLGEVDGPPGGPEVQQRVAPGRVEQAVAQVLQDGGPAVGAGAEHALEVEVLGLVAVGLQPRDDVGEILGAASAVGRDHRLLATVASTGCRAGARANRLFRRSCSRAASASSARSRPHTSATNSAQARDVGELVVVAGQVLPALPPGDDPDGALLGGGARLAGGTGEVPLDGPPMLDLDRRRHLRGRDRRPVPLRRPGLRDVDGHRLVVGLREGAEPAQRGDPAGLVQRLHRAEHREQQAEDVVGGQPAAGHGTADQRAHQPAAAVTLASARSPRSSSSVKRRSTSSPRPTRRATASTAPRSSTPPPSSAVAKSTSTAAR